MEDGFQQMPPPSSSNNTQIANKIARMLSSSSVSDLESQEFYDCESVEGQRKDSFKSISDKEESKQKKPL
jgi:hypothetical protein